MKFYQVKYRREGGCSDGCTWHSTRTEAVKARTHAVESDPAEYTDGPPEIFIVTFVPDKAGILDTLRRYASHPDNG